MTGGVLADPQTWRAAAEVLALMDAPEAPAGPLGLQARAVLPEDLRLRVMVDAVPDARRTRVRLAKIQGTFGYLAPTGAPARLGDYVDATVVALDDDGAELEQLTASYRVGWRSWLPGLDDAVIGRRDGDTVELRAHLEHGPLAGRTVTVLVHLGMVAIRRIPPADDHLARRAGQVDAWAAHRWSRPVTTMSGLWAELEREELGRARQERARVVAVEELVRRSDVAVPESLVRSAVAYGEHPDDARERLGRTAVLDALVARWDVQAAPAEYAAWLAPRLDALGDWRAERRLVRAMVDMITAHSRATGRLPRVLDPVRRETAVTQLLEYGDVVTPDGARLDLDDRDETRMDW